MPPSLGRIILYTKRLSEMIEFYCRHFNYECIRHEDDRIVELRPLGTGAAILLHPAAKGQKEGQALVKLVFDVADVDAFCRDAEKRGLKFGAIHRANGYAFANAKDPSKNSVSVSSRAMTAP